MSLILFLQIIPCEYIRTPFVRVCILERRIILFYAFGALTSSQNSWYKTSIIFKTASLLMA